MQGQENSTIYSRFQLISIFIAIAGFLIAGIMVFSYIAYDPIYKQSTKENISPESSTSAKIKPRKYVSEEVFFEGVRCIIFSGEIEEVICIPYDR